jgi:hypothetical protein
MTRYHGIGQGILWVHVNTYLQGFYSQTLLSVSGYKLWVHVNSYLQGIIQRHSLRDTLLDDKALSEQCPSPVCVLNKG